MITRAGIALGSNIEPRFGHLQAACQHILRMHQEEARPALISRVYITSPVDCPEGSTPFLNAVMEISTTIPPVSLVEELQRIEAGFGREHLPATHAPRTIDLDLLYVDDLRLSTPELTLPHPRIANRKFVLAPLADIRPNMVLPPGSKSIEAILESLKSDEIVAVYTDSLL